MVDVFQSASRATGTNSRSRFPWETEIGAMAKNNVDFTTGVYAG